MKFLGFILVSYQINYLFDRQFHYRYSITMFKFYQNLSRENKEKFLLIICIKIICSLESCYIMFVLDKRLHSNILEYIFLYVYFILIFPFLTIASYDIYKDTINENNRSEKDGENIRLCGTIV